MGWVMNLTHRNGYRSFSMGHFNNGKKYEHLNHVYWPSELASERGQSSFSAATLVGWKNLSPLVFPSVQINTRWEFNFNDLAR